MIEKRLSLEPEIVSELSKEKQKGAVGVVGRSGGAREGWTAENVANLGQLGLRS